MIRFVIDTLGGMWELLRLAWVTKFKFRGAYWSWRMHTAYGAAGRPPRGRLVHDTLEYARWVRRMRQGM